MTTTSILKPSGTGFEWCINQFDGCTHGCKYCYGMMIRRKSYADWIKAKSKEDAIDKLKKRHSEAARKQGKDNRYFSGFNNRLLSAA